MNRDHLRKMLLASMMILVFAFVGCSDDDDDGGTNPPTPVDEFAMVVPVTNDYVSTYAPTNGGSGLGMNASASAFFDAYFPVAKAAPNTDDFYVIDWRTSAAWENARIEGSVNMSIKEIITKVNDGTIPTDKTIVSVCYSGQNASTATAILNLLGYDAVNLKFGMSSWTSNTDYAGTDYYAKVSDAWEEDFVTTDFPKPAAGDFPVLDMGEDNAMDIIKARAHAYVNGQYNSMGGSSWNGTSVEVFYPEDLENWHVINYFPTAEYEAGHLPEAIRYQPKADLLSTADLNTLPTDKKIAVYCWTGQTSAQMAVVLNMLGYEAYTVTYGVQKMCYTNSNINTHPYSVPTTDYPCVGTGVEM